VAGPLLAPNGPRVADAFSLTPDPSAYVPRLALEAALAELAEGVGKTPSCAALTGEAGLGKTLLLHLLRERLLGAFECLYVPFPRLEASELWRWTAVALGLGGGQDDRAAVLGRAHRLHHADGNGLVLLVDDAAALPAATRADLLAAANLPGLSLVLAFGSEDRSQLEALPAHVRRVELGPPMTLAETRSYVHARLRRADPSGALAACLTARQLAAFHADSSGVPARLHALLDGWVRSIDDEPIEPAEVAAKPSAAPVTPALGAEPVAVVMPDANDRIAAWERRLRSPRARVALVTLFVLATLGTWLFVLQRTPAGSSVGVPVERSEPAPQEPAPAPAPPPPPAASAAVEPAPPASEPAASIEVAPTAPSRPLAPPLPAAPPIPDPNQPEPAVHISTLPFPDEHVPALLEPQPLAAPPPGPRLSVNAAPWAEISLDGHPVGDTPLGELRVTPGAHVVSAKLPDGRVVERSVEARAGDLYVVFP